MFEQRQEKERQQELWIMPDELPAATPDAFYRRVNRTLDAMEFAPQVWAICRPAYADASRGGRPGIDPVVYLKMLMVGFFENLGSERAIASRCADSLSIRGFLGYTLTEATPDHSSLSVIRERLSLEQMQALHRVLLAALHKNGLLKGRKLGIDSSIIEANASLRALEHRNTEQSYWEYVQNLAAQSGIDPQDSKAVRRFDKKRTGRKTSNQDWVNPHDPEAKVGRTKDGACDMVYKPEHISDLESGAIIHAEVRQGDAADNDATLPERVEQARTTLRDVLPEDQRDHAVQELCADEGYFAVEPVARLQEAGVRTVISDPHGERRRKDKLEPRHHRALHRARCATRSASGKALLRSRGEHLERGFAHVLDHGRLRRATLRGTENLSKRLLLGALTHNLSLLLRHQTGIGTAKQALAAAAALLCALVERIWSWLRVMCRPTGFMQRITLLETGHRSFLVLIRPDMQNYRSSTGC
jgi:transposase